MSEEQPKMNWGRRLANLLKERAISQKELAKAIHVSPSVLNGWLAGASPNDFAKVKALSDFLGVSFTWLLTGEQDGHPGSPGIEDVFDSEHFFEGNVRIRIEKLVPRRKCTKPKGEK